MPIIYWYLIMLTLASLRAALITIRYEFHTTEKCVTQLLNKFHRSLMRCKNITAYYNFKLQKTTSALKIYHLMLILVIQAKEAKQSKSTSEGNSFKLPCLHWTTNYILTTPLYSNQTHHFIIVCANDCQCFVFMWRFKWSRRAARKGHSVQG